MEASNAYASDQSERQEQGMWITKDPDTGEYAYALFDEGFSNFSSCTFYYDNPPIPPDAVTWVHTQPFAIGEILYPCHIDQISKSQLDAFIQINPALRDEYEYKGAPSPDDVKAAAYFKSRKPGLKFYAVDIEGITEYDEQSPTEELGNSPRHTQNCYQN